MMLMMMMVMISAQLGLNSTQFNSLAVVLVLLLVVGSVSLGKVRMLHGLKSKRGSKGRKEGSRM